MLIILFIVSNYDSDNQNSNHFVLLMTVEKQIAITNAFF